MYNYSELENLKSKNLATSPKLFIEKLLNDLFIKKQLKEKGLSLDLNTIRTALKLSISSQKLPQGLSTEDIDKMMENSANEREFSVCLIKIKKFQKIYNTLSKKYNIGLLNKNFRALCSKCALNLTGDFLASCWSLKEKIKAGMTVVTITKVTPLPELDKDRFLSGRCPSKTCSSNLIYLIWNPK